jgi:NAD(P)H-hydrate epimerase
MSRLTGASIEDIQKNRIKYAKEFSDKYNVITVLKGARTIIATPDGKIYINPTGNPGMSTAGTGDVLTGIIAGFLGQGIKPEDAAAAGVFLHAYQGTWQPLRKVNMDL